MKGRRDIPEYGDREPEMGFNQQAVVVVMLFASEDNRPLLISAPQ